MLRLGFICSLLVLILAPAGARAAGRSYDDGRLDASWFSHGGPAITFRETDEIDYLWVKPGFALAGQKLRFAKWPDPEFIGEEAADRDTKDKRLARQINVTMPDVFAESFHNAFGSRITTVDSGEDIRVEGRIVDCSTGSRAAKILVGFGAGAGSTTVDLKLVDAQTGDLLVAIHHRAVSGTDWSTTDSKFVKWADEMTEAAAKHGFAKLYEDGDRIRK